MRRRGPDAGGFAQAAGLAAAHRRLSIIDPQGSPQPWVDASSGDVLVFNGELYNYRELRSVLRSEGVHCRSEGDTEVLLRALQHWGRDALGKLNGMFAFAWYRAADQRMWLVRDHAGIKPLFYARVGTRCYFASTVAAVLTFPGVSRDIDLVALSHYLSTIRSTLGERTLVRGISTLEPGHLLEISPGRPAGHVQRWWQLPALAPTQKCERDIREVAEEVFERVRRAVERQLVSDVPLGGFLSGGLDSTIIASQAADLSQGEYRSYAVGYRREDTAGTAYHEFPYVQLAAEHFGLPCKRIELDEAQYLEDWRWLIEQKGQPLSTPNEVGIYRLARALREHCTVALSGEGADEAFAGYAVPYASAWDFERATRLSTWAEEQRDTYERSLIDLYGTTRFASQTDHYFRLNSWIPLGLKYKILTTESIVGAQHDEPMLEHYQSLLAQLKHLTPMDRYLHLLARGNLESLLSRLDASTMAASVESRVPFTDPELLDCAFRLQDVHKLDFVDDGARRRGRALNAQELGDGGYLCSKRALREAFRHVVPQPILDRRKVSFATPFQECLAGPWHAFARDTLLSSELVGQLCNRKAVEFLLSHGRDGGEHQDLTIALWPLLNLAVWAESFDVTLPGSPLVRLAQAAPRHGGTFDGASP